MSSAAIFVWRFRVKYTPCHFSPLAEIPGSIGDNAVTSSIWIAQVFPDLVGKKTRALWKVYGEGGGAGGGGG